MKFLTSPLECPPTMPLPNYADFDSPPRIGASSHAEGRVGASSTRHQRCDESTAVLDPPVQEHPQKIARLLHQFGKDLWRRGGRRLVTDQGRDAQVAAGQ